MSTLFISQTLCGVHDEVAKEGQTEVSLKFSIKMYYYALVSELDLLLRSEIPRKIIFSRPSWDSNKNRRFQMQNKQQFRYIHSLPHFR